MLRTGWIGLAALAGLLSASSALASPVKYVGEEKNLTDFSISGGPLLSLTATYNYNNTFTGHFASQAYSLADGTYLYLYQADNWGPSFLEVVSINAMHDVIGGGWLGGGEPPLFVASGSIPYNGKFTYETSIANPYVSFNYPSVVDAEVSAGQHTRVLFLRSNQPPVVGEAYVIDSGIAVVPAVVAIPEPVSLSLLALGAGTLLIKRRARR